MNIQTLEKSHQKELVSHFTSVFTTTEGIKEGKLIGKLVAKLSSNIDDREIICFGTYKNEMLVGSIFFSRLRFKDSHLIYMLSPVAVSDEYQGNGIGQTLINYGIKVLKNRSVDVIITYGNPYFYSKVGFQKLPTTVIQPPHQLSMPEGWLGKSLTEKQIPIIKDRPICTKEFNDTVYW